METTLRQNGPHIASARSSWNTGDEARRTCSARAAATSSAVLLGRTTACSDVGTPWSPQDRGDVPRTRGRLAADARTAAQLAEVALSVMSRPIKGRQCQGSGFVMVGGIPGFVGCRPAPVTSNDRVVCRATVFLTNGWAVITNASAIRWRDNEEVRRHLLSARFQGAWSAGCR